MSVEKFIPSFDEGVIKHETKPYTQILNKVLQECKNPEALGVWCYLQSRPENWVVSPQHLQNHFGMGRDKVYKLLNYLIDSNLLERKRPIMPDGTYGKTNYIIRNGDKFMCKNLSTNPLPDLPDTVKPDTVNQYTTNKRESIKERESKKKRERSLNSVQKKSYCPGTSESLISDQAIKLALEKKLDIEKLVYSFQTYAKSHGWTRSDWKAAFIKWILDERPSCHANSKEYQKPNEIRSTVPEVRGLFTGYEQAKPEIAKKHLGDIMSKLKGSSHGEGLGKGTGC